SAGGKAVLAALPVEEQEHYLATVELVPRTESTIRSRKELREQEAKAAADGAAVSLKEHTPGIVSVAAAVRRSHGYPLGALNFVIPEVRFDEAVEAHCRKVLKTAVSRLEKALHSVETAPSSSNASKVRRRLK